MPSPSFENLNGRYGHINKSALPQGGCGFSLSSMREVFTERIWMVSNVSLLASFAHQSCLDWRTTSRYYIVIRYYKSDQTISFRVSD